MEEVGAGLQAVQARNSNGLSFPTGQNALRPKKREDIEKVGRHKTSSVKKGFWLKTATSKWFCLSQVITAYFGGFFFLPAPEASFSFSTPSPAPTCAPPPKSSFRFTLFGVDVGSEKRDGPPWRTCPTFWTDYNIVQRVGYSFFSILLILLF